MPISYRSILGVEPTESLVDDVERVVNEWLQSKGLPVVTEAGTLFNNGREISRADWVNDHVTSRRWQLREHWDEPKWFTGVRAENRVAVTSITVVRGEEQARLWVDIDSPTLRYTNRRGDEVLETQQSGTPRVIKALIEAVETSDGSALPFSDPLMIASRTHLEELLTILQDEKRIGAAFVTTPPEGVTSAEWAQSTKEMIHGTEGMATSYILDPGLLSSFNGVAKTHWLRAGSLRTFLPAVKLGDLSDAYRHKYLSQHRIVTANPRGLSRMLRNSEVRRLSQLRLPATLREVDYGLLRSQRFQPLADFQELERENENAQASGNVENLIALNAKLAAQLQGQQHDALVALEEAVRLMEEVDDLKETIQVMELESAELAARAETSQDLVDALRRRLINLQAVGDAYAPLDESERTAYPDSFYDLLERIGEFDRIRFVGRKDPAVALDEHPNIAIAVHKAWDALAAFHDYANLTVTGTWTGGGLYQYINDGGHRGRARVLGYRPTESETVQSNPRMMAERTVSVPSAASPSGTIVMTTHIALLNGRAGAPRMYLHDSAQSDGYVYIGYIGEHLTTARY
ncbi:hypothetical protein G9E11_12270 [Arthrobacter sp. IA7]|uniref:hypothetical protein n=1 Tax=Arthrobacter ipis TaxID=2716202 RepID=UPI001687C7CF|nr:hypothetical protein [Arthrobacter ipis]MBD1543006.1 hypothetical protein [Arthrobacter ipis]